MLRKVSRRKKRVITAPATVSAIPEARPTQGALVVRICQKSVPTKQAKANGTRYFQQSDIIWSTRMRGSVQRTQMMRNMRPTVFDTKMAMESACQPHQDRPGSIAAPARRLEGGRAEEGDLPAAEEQGHGHRRHHPQVPELDQEEDGEAEAGVLREVAGHQLRLGLGQVERGAVALGQLAR